MGEDDLAPFKHMIAKSSSEKAILVRIILIVELYEEEYFPEIKEASLLYMMDAEVPQPPVVYRENYWGEGTMFNFYHLIIISNHPHCGGV